MLSDYSIVRDSYAIIGLVASSFVVPHLVVVGQGSVVAEAVGRCALVVEEVGRGALVVEEVGRGALVVEAVERG